MRTSSRTEIDSRSLRCGDKLPAHASISITGKQLDLLLLFRGGTQQIKQLCIAVAIEYMYDTLRKRVFSIIAI
jgi:hypothetical protein